MRKQFLSLTMMAILLSCGIVSETSAKEVIFFAAGGNDGNYAIYRVNPDGTDLRLLSESVSPPANELVPAVSPDGEWVAYQSQYNGVWKMRPDGTERCLVEAHGGGVATTGWSPDGTMILYNNVSTCSEDLYAVGPNCGSIGRLFVDAGVDIPEPVAFDVSWPIQSKLAVFGAGCGGSRTLYMWNQSTSHFESIPILGYHLNEMDLSPDGERFALSIQTTRPDGGVYSNIYTANADGSGLRQLTFNTDSYTYDVFPSWSPDGSKIVFCHQIPYDHVLQIVNADGSGNPVRIPIFTDQKIRVYHPDWARIREGTPPVALCRNARVPAGVDCTAIITASSIDDGSYDPDGGPVTLSVDSAGPFAPGDHAVTLTATDEDGDLTSCTATVTVVDDTAPEPTLTDPVCVIRNGGSAKQMTAAASDNCSGAEATIESVQILNNGGNPVNGSGVHEVVGNDIFVYPNGNGWTAVVTVVAVDDGGNTATATITKALPKCK